MKQIDYKSLHDTVINYDNLIKQLGNLSVFEIWRIYCVTSHAMENPAKLLEIKKQLRPNMEISYFEMAENRLVEAMVVTINRNSVLVRNKHDGRSWRLPFYMLNIDNRTIKSQSTPILGKMSKIDLRVGDKVGWASSRCNQDLYGTVLKLNPKTVKIQRPDGEIWTVAYSLLFSTFDAQQISSYQGEHMLIDGDFESIASARE